MPTETLGEIAYNAYCATRDWKAFNGDALPPFKELTASKPDIARGWEIAAQAVIGAAAGIEHVSNEDNLPVVAGPFTETVEIMTHRARVLLRDAVEELASPALVAFLCDAIRMYRPNEQKPFVYKPRWLFQAGDTVRHRKGNEYRITHGLGDNLMIEATGEPAYAYEHEDSRGHVTRWVRPAREMEDGRFALIVHCPPATGTHCP